MKKTFNKISLLALIILLFTASLSSVSFDDAIKKLGPGKDGIKTAYDYVALVNKMAKNLKYNKSAKSFIDFLEEAVKNFDWMQLYESKYFIGRNKGFRFVTFRGHNLAKYFQVDMVRGRYSDVKIANFGDFGAEYGLRKIDKSIVGDRSFQAYAKFRINSKYLQHTNFSAYLSGLQQVIAPENISTLTALDTQIYTNIKGDGRKLLNEYSRKLPRFAGYLAKYSKLKSLLKIKKSKEGRAYTHLMMHGTVNLKNIKADFEELYDYLDDIEGMAKVKITITNSKGHILTSFAIDSKTRSINWQLYSANGKIIPYTRKGTPIFKEAFDIATLKKYTSYITFNGKLNISGLKMESGNVIIRSDYKNNGKTATLHFKVTKVPNPKIYGRIYGIIPKWLIDIAIPGNVDELAAKFSKLMAKGNNGSGTQLTLFVNAQNTSKVKLTISASTEFIDNRFVRFGLKIWSRKFRPSDETVADFKKLIALFSGQLQQDLGALGGWR